MTYKVFDIYILQKLQVNYRTNCVIYYIHQMLKNPQYDTYVIKIYFHKFYRAKTQFTIL